MAQSSRNIAGACWGRNRSILFLEIIAKYIGVEMDRQISWFCGSFSGHNCRPVSAISSKVLYGARV